MATTSIRSRDSRGQRSFGVIKVVARDLAAMFSFGILLLCIHELASPFVRGFQCNDETIRYPFKESTVSSGVCYLVGSGLNVLLILVLEYLMLVDNTNNNNDGNTARGGEIPGESFQMRVYLRNVYCRLVVWFFGSIASELLTDICKVTAGRLRPHFIYVCEPTVNGLPLDVYCQSPNAEPYKYITNYNCNGNPKKLRDIRLSFLSGHSSYSAYSATFAVIYIQTAMNSIRFGLIKPLIQVLIISAALYTGLSRVSDYKHHWQDVLAGLLLGTTVASLVHIHLWPSFQKSYSKLLTAFDQRTQPHQSGEELNNLSY